MGTGKGKNRRVSAKSRQPVKTWAAYDALPPRVRTAYKRGDDDFGFLWENVYKHAVNNEGTPALEAKKEADEAVTEARIKDKRLRERYPIDSGALMTEAAGRGGVGWDYQ